MEIDSSLDDQPVAKPKVKDTERVRSAVEGTPIATFDDLIKKKPREATVRLTTAGDDGKPREIALRYKAISSADYDRLLNDHPPTAAQRRDNNAYNIDTFAPALISACCVEPRLSYDQAREIYTSDAWSAGELGGLFLEALRICNAGIDVPFTAGG